MDGIRRHFLHCAPHIAGSALNEEEMVKAFNAAKIVLNLQPPQTITGGNYKIFEIAGSGAFQWIHYIKDLETSINTIPPSVMRFRVLSTWRASLSE